MNVSALKQGLTIANNAVKELVSAQKNLSAGKKKDKIGQLLKDAQERLKEAEARIAHELEFPICKRCWPPEIMVHNDENEYVCRNCGKEVPADVASKVSDIDDLATW